MRKDTETFTQFRRDFENALKDICEKYDVDIETGNISYEATQFNMKVTVKDRMSAEERFMDDYNHSWLFAYPISVDMLNKRFRGNDGKVYTLIGINRTARKTSKVVRIEADNGLKYVCEPEFLGITQKGLGGKTGNRI